MTASRPRLGALVAVGAAVAALVLGLGAWLPLRAGPAAVHLQRVDVERVLDRAAFEPTPAALRFILLIGSDERPGVGGARADALHLVAVDPATRQGTILNFPRDSWVQIPGHGRNKINAAYTLGGAELQAATVSRLTGVRIDLVAVTTFVGFQAMVDEVGGVGVHVPVSMNDPFSGAVLSAGPQRLSGAQALAFARNRHLPGGDFARTTNQAHLLLSALGELRGRGTGPADTARYVATLLRHVRVDGIGVTELYRLGRLALEIDPGSIRNVTVPGSLGYAGRTSVVHLSPRAGDLFADFREDAVLQRH